MPSLDHFMPSKKEGYNKDINTPDNRTSSNGNGSVGQSITVYSPAVYLDGQKITESVANHLSFQEARA